jgi:hypothetical protein
VNICKELSLNHSFDKNAEVAKREEKISIKERLAAA